MFFFFKGIQLNLSNYLYHAVISKTCTLKPQKGPCRGGIEMYYFDASTLNCSTFSWGGCQGNGNRFNTFDECLDKCLSKKGSKRKLLHIILYLKNSTLFSKSDILLICLMYKPQLSKKTYNYEMKIQPPFKDIEFT